MQLILMMMVMMMMQLNIICFLSGIAHGVSLDTSSSSRAAIHTQQQKQQRRALQRLHASGTDETER